MSKRVPMVLSKSISKLGKIGDLVEVAPGYARNYLLPQKLAVIATSSILKQVEQRRAGVGVVHELYWSHEAARRVPGNLRNSGHCRA